MNQSTMSLVPDTVTKLSKDLKNSASLLSPTQARYLVDTFYDIQKTRVATGNQKKALDKAEEPFGLQEYLQNNLLMLEKEIKKAMLKYAESHSASLWAMNQLGIGPVIAAALEAYVDPGLCQSATHLYKYAGLVPGQKKKRGQKLDYNPDLKRLCWIIGESFVKVSNKPDSLYGRLYKERKEYEKLKNQNLEYKDQAEKSLKEKDYDKSTEAYKWYSKGMLPPNHINSRAKRYATKIFLSHFTQVMWESTHDEPWAMPYAIAILGHADYIPVPR